jgi:transcriptional regulator with XRE-family HTH domain
MPFTDAIDPACLRILREAAGLSRTQLGAAIGVSDQQVWRWEHDSGHPPNRGRLIQIALVCGVSPLDLLAPERADELAGT